MWTIMLLKQIKRLKNMPKNNKIRLMKMIKFKIYLKIIKIINKMMLWNYNFNLWWTWWINKMIKILMQIFNCLTFFSLLWALKTSFNQTFYKCLQWIINSNLVKKKRIKNKIKERKKCKKNTIKIVKIQINQK